MGTANNNPIKTAKPMGFANTMTKSDHSHDFPVLGRGVFANPQPKKMNPGNK
jgi:hypothetical protein